jgi:hypothetical protein
MRDRFARLVVAASLTLLALFAPRRAAAYPWMIRHDYNVCSVCHTDPSGANLLTAYGRSLSQTLLSSELLAKRDEEPGKFKEFAFGIVPMPESLQAGAFLRGGYIANYRDGSLVDDRTLRMRADVEGHAQFGAFRMNGQIGVLPGASASFGREAQVNRATGDELAVVARTYWAGYEMNDGDALLRAGRLYMPFGLRNVEHNSWVRSATKTDINQHQQHGVSYYWSNGTYRAEAMAVLGNFQLRPDDFRERGVVGYVERRISGKQAFAVQAQALRSSSESFALTGGSLLRQGYGVTYRLAPTERLALLTEANVLVNTFETGGTRIGHVAFFQADLEPLNGVHVMATLEEMKQAIAGQEQRYGAWLSSAYFPVPHTELRVDGILRTNGSEPASMTLLFQGQLYL